MGNAFMNIKKSLLKPVSRKSNNDYLERRREQRLPAHLPSILLNKDQTIYTTIINLSSNGVGFLSEERLIIVV